jgi:hypothetical protein
MKRLALALMMAAVAGGATTSFAFNSMQGGGGFHGGGGRGASGVQVAPGFSGGQRFTVVRPGFPVHSGFAQPGFVHPGFVRPGFVNPGFVHPGFPFRHHGFPFRHVVVVGVGGPVFWGWGWGPPPVVFVSGAPALWYCSDPPGYFPTIPACSVDWIQVQ